jgi:hypothetical protein
VPPNDSAGDDWRKSPHVEKVFADPRYKHLRAFADYDDDEAEQLNYDRAMTLQALAALYQLQSTEKQGQTMARATWALFWATLGLFAATIVLVVVTVTNGG